MESMRIFLSKIKKEVRICETRDLRFRTNYKLFLVYIMLLAKLFSMKKVIFPNSWTNNDLVLLRQKRRPLLAYVLILNNIKKD